MRDFLKLNDERIRKNTIKKYQPFSEKKIKVYYNTSRYKIEVQVFGYATESLRNEAIEYLDLNFGL